MNILYTIKLFVILNLKYSDCYLKDLGEVTNFTEFIDTDMYKLAGPAIKMYGQSSLAPVPTLKGSLGIAGGNNAFIIDFPYNVLFLNHQGMCAGSIISDKIVLTAAHCLDHSVNLLEMRIYAGSRYIFDQAADAHMVWDFAVHDRYNDPIRFANDAALLIIHDKFRFKATVQRAQLVNHKDWMRKGNAIRVSGWGETAHGTQETSKNGLQSIKLKFMSFGDCHKDAGTPMSPDMFCMWGDGEQATCRGDSGGGAVWKHMVVGIVSHGGTCLQYPGIFTNVFYLRPWIEIASKNLYNKFCHFHEPNPSDY